MEILDKSYLDSLIQNQVEENIELEYKSAAALDNTTQKKKEISKDVSAMANSAGGILIYGIKEFDEEGKRHLPKEINPVIRKNYSKEWLEQVVQSNIQPKIPNIIIDPINISKEEVVYRILIPQSNTAHQANDKRYYKRYNFESVAMEDYEIKDILNRHKHPNIIVQFEIEEHSYEKKRNPMIPTFGFEKKDEKPEIIMNTKLIVYFKNIGDIYANYINGYVFIPFEIYKEIKDVDDDRINYIDDQKYVRCYCENTIREVVGFESNPLIGSISNYGPSRFDPLLPRMRLNSKDIFLKNGFYTYLDKVIHWELNADNAELKKGSIRINEVKQIYRNK